MVYIVVVWYNTPGSETNVEVLVAGVLSLDWLAVVPELSDEVLGTGVLGGTMTGGVIGVAVAELDREELIVELPCPGVV